jgi:hypothetical protein
METLKLKTYLRHELFFTSRLHIVEELNNKAGSVNKNAYGRTESQKMKEKKRVQQTYETL